MSYPTPDMRFEDTGVSRPPRRGEWFTGIVGPSMAPHDFFSNRPILRRVDAGPRCEEELDRELLDAEGRAEARLNAGQRDERTTGLPAPDSGCESRAPLHKPKPNDLRPIEETARQVRRQVKNGYLPYSDPED